MTQEHPVAPPPELVYDWAEDRARLNDPTPLPEYIATRAAQWGADQELEACCEYLVRRAQWESEDVDEFRAARRPKPPSLKGRIAAEIENGIACDRESERITHDVIREVTVWIDRLGYHSCATELLGEINK
jgi:hypothetical protein